MPLITNNLNLTFEMDRHQQDAMRTYIDEVNQYILKTNINPLGEYHRTVFKVKLTRKLKHPKTTTITIKWKANGFLEDTLQTVLEVIFMVKYKIFILHGPNDILYQFRYHDGEYHPSLYFYITPSKECAVNLDRVIEIFKGIYLRPPKKLDNIDIYKADDNRMAIYTKYYNEDFIVSFVTNIAYTCFNNGIVANLEVSTNIIGLK